MCSLRQKPLSRRLKNKIGYIGHRRYLPTDRDWRKYTKEFDGNTEEQGAPEKFTAEEVAEPAMSAW